MSPDEIMQLNRLLEDDQWTKYPKYPEQARYALHDDNVRRLLGEMHERAALTDVVTLGYSFFLGLNAICFKFSASGMLDGSQNILVLLDRRCHVVGVVEKFNLDQPNDLLPPLPNRGEQPFVLAQPSGGASEVPAAEMWARDIHSTAYLKKLVRGGRVTPAIGESDDGDEHLDGGGGDDDDGGGGDDGIGGGGGGGGDTMCVYATTVQTLVGTTCRQYTGFPIPIACDAYGNVYEPDEQTDYVVDDSG